MDAYLEVAPLELVRLRRVLNAREMRLHGQVDPLRRLIQRRDEQIADTLRRLKQIDVMRRRSDVGPAESYEN